MLTADRMYPSLLHGRLRTLFASTCNTTHKFYYVSGAGDTWTTMGKYGYYGCSKQWAWLDAFYRAIGGRLNQDHWAVLDVGGNLGQEPIIAGLHGYHSYTFEPFSFNQDSLRFNAALNCVHDRVHVINMGASDKPGSACFSTNPKKNGISNAGTGVERGGHGRSCINMTSLDVASETIFDELRKPLLLKIDCEGQEENALAGAHELLSSTPPVVITMEVIHPKKRLAGFVAKLRAYGYAIYSKWHADSASPGCASQGSTECQAMTAHYWEDVTDGQPIDIVAVHVATVFKQKRIWHGVFDHARLVQIAARM